MGSEFEGGKTDEGKRISMHYHKTLGDLGNKMKSVAHEMGHTFGLKDPPDIENTKTAGDYYTPGGIMEYKINLDDMNLPSPNDIENIILYARGFLNQGESFNYKDGAKVTLLEVVGSAEKKNPLGKVAMKPTGSDQKDKPVKKD